MTTRQNQGVFAPRYKKAQTTSAAAAAKKKKGASPKKSQRRWEALAVMAARASQEAAK